ncbi:MAG: CRISPR-associated helicase Cas3' [Candidatus Eremiobacterota bacterium]
MDFATFFRQATGNPPYPYQVNLAEATGLPGCLEVPTGAGKTSAILLAWLWRRRTRPETTPRRLVYCLPMRVLVEQTLTCAQDWLNKLNLRESVHLAALMGGRLETDWDVYPDRDAILVGTQDQLLSRALNRGYAMSRYRWPLHFGLLSNDCLWVLDELQLMGPGLTTSAQLQALRTRFATFGPSHTLWMSATIRRDWLRTIDFDPDAHPPTLTLSDDDQVDPRLGPRLCATKPLHRCAARMGDSAQLAQEILTYHREGTRTLAVLNTVKQATALFEALRKKKPKAALVLIHSRFRPGDRQCWLQKALSQPGEAGTVVVSTQVIEAGVDLSARLLFTELAPWPSLVQRFGRCNRYGTESEPAVYWLDLAAKPDVKPYDLERVEHAREQVAGLSDVGPGGLPPVQEDFQRGPTLRAKDLQELFDTTPDLAGFDVDVSRFIRDADETDAQVFWRDVDAPEDDEPEPARDELCSVPLGDLRAFLKDRKGWVRDPLDGRWVDAGRLYPGITVMLPAAGGGYEPEVGWNPRSKRVEPVRLPAEPPEAYDQDPWSEGDWESIARHTQAVVDEMKDLLALVPDDHRATLLTAARWHDAGKAHEAFQACFKEAPPVEVGLAAKAPRSAWKRGRPGRDDRRRRHFRHELASAILALLHRQPDLVAYLCACHHGKVRVSIRSMPDERHPPEPHRRFARGVWDGDVLGPVDLGDGTVIPETALDLSYLELGEGERGPSWLARALAIVDALGPFRLAYLEALMKCADERASARTALLVAAEGRTS